MWTRTGQAGTRRVVTYSYDAMSRLQSVAANWDNNPTTSVNVAANAQYNFQGAMTSWNILGQTETRQYNTLGQLTRIQGAGINIEYQFSATANDGKITGQKNWATGEEVTYQYDALERLISAATAASTGSSAWGLSWSYDGFGNRLNQNVTKGTAPTMSTLVDANTNRLSGFGYSYDGNGNLLKMPQQSASMTYDGSNRMVKFTNQNDTESYQYAPDNKRVWRSKGCSYQSVVDGSTQVAPALTFYSVFGQKLGDYCYPPGGGQVVEENVHFWGRIVAKGDAGGSLAALATDRLHSKGDGSTFFPYGETKSGATITGDSFATYSRDWSGLDYADQRWYSPAVGRFTTSDPFMKSARTNDSGSWNRFSYVESNPIDHLDPNGLAKCTVGSWEEFGGKRLARVHCYDSTGIGGEFEGHFEYFGDMSDAKFRDKFAQDMARSSWADEQQARIVEAEVNKLTEFARLAFNSEGCRNVFSGVGVISTAQALSLLSTPEGWFNQNIAVEWKPIISMGESGSARTRGEGVYFARNPSNILGYSVVKKTATIRFNPMMYPVMDTRERVLTFLHELGHAISHLSWGRITGGFVHLDSEEGVNAENDRLIKLHCMSVLPL